MTLTNMNFPTYCLLIFLPSKLQTGYLTNTGIKFMAAINDTGNANKQWDLAREGGLKALFVSDFLFNYQSRYYVYCVKLLKSSQNNDIYFLIFTLTGKYA